MTKKNHRCKDCIKTGTPRPYVWCKICKKGYIDFCILGHKDFELK